MTDKQDRIIKVYKALTETKEVYPSYRVIAKVAKVSVSTAHKVILEWKAQNQAFGIKK